MTSTRSLSILRSAILAGSMLGSLVWSGCSSMGAARLDPQLVAAMSPTAEAATPRQAAQWAREYVAAHPGTEVALGTGDSMMPRYRDNTVIVVEHRPMSELKPGMTIVFRSPEGWPVAHAVVAQTSDGWITEGLNNAAPDDQPVTEGNYVGVVVKAYELSGSPMLALSRELSAETDDAYAMTRSNAMGALAKAN
jgi:signal peptidase I